MYLHAKLLASEHPRRADAAAASQDGAALEWGSLPGLDPAADALLKPDRAQRKREQLQSLLHLLQVHVMSHLTEEGRSTKRPHNKQPASDLLGVKRVPATYQHQGHHTTDGITFAPLFPVHKFE